MTEDTVIKVDKVSKNFTLPHLRKNSVKGVFTGLFDSSPKLQGSETQHALKDISFEVKKGEFFGIVGRNGSGKSTLLKMLAGIYQPTKGKVTVSGKLVPFIELGVGFNPELTGRENIYLNGALLNFSKSEIDKMYDDIVAFAEIERFMDQKLKNYSSGMQVRLAFSMAIRAEADILLVDEVLAVGDADFQRKCFEYFRTLKRKKKTVIFVSHDMSAVSEYCSRALLLEKGSIATFGNTEEVVREYHKLFINEQDSDTNIENSESTRWGTQLANYKEVKVKQNDSKVIVNCKIIAKSKLESVHYGLHIFSQDGTELTATNNRLLGISDIKNIHPGESLAVNWQVQNIFNDGKYFVTVTLVDEVEGVLDWYSEAARFTVKRIERSTTHVLPPINLEIKRSLKNE